MKSVLFCHDGPLSINNKGEIYGIAHTNEIFSRYKNISEDVNVLIRLKNIEDTSGLNKINTNDFNIIEAPNMSSLKSIRDTRENIRKLESIIKQHDYIVIRIPGILGLVCNFIAKKHSKKILIELVGDPYLAYKNHSFKGKLVAPMLNIFYKQMMLESKYSLYVTSEYLQKKYPDMGNSISCSNVDLSESDYFYDDKKYDDFKRKTINIGTISPLDVKFKNQKAVILAISYLKKLGHTNYQYFMVGPGNKESLEKIAIENNVFDQIIFLGSLKRNEINNFLDSLDIYIQPSKQEGLPRAVIEAMSRGVVCLGAQTAGIPELIEEKYQFTNRGSNYKEISQILLDLNEEELKESSILNYQNSKLYSKSKLSVRRSTFFKEFSK